MMIVVISPAKRLDFSSVALAKQSAPLFAQDAAKLVTQLKKKSAKDLQELMSVSAKIAELNVARFKQWSKTPKAGMSKQALLAFRGDVYLGIDADTLDATDINFAQKHLRILSGLYGVLRPLDVIQAYRLEMGTPLVNPRGKNLYDFWGERITEALNQEFKNSQHADLVHLASNEYFRSIIPEQLSARVITPVFKEKKNGQYKVISFVAKRARGMMTRYIIKNRITEVARLKQFRDEGYRYRAELSDAARWVFTRA